MRRFLSRSASRPAPCTRLSLEQLEDRLTPSVTVVGSAFTVVGDGKADAVTILTDGQGDVTASLQSAAGTTTASAVNITSIQVDGGTGQDTVAVRFTGALTTDLSLMLCLGKASDAANLDVSAGVNGGALHIDEDGGVGNAQFSAVVGKLTNATVEYKACLGKGNVSDNLLFAGPISGSNVDVTVSANGGSDAISEVFNGPIINSQIDVENHLSTGVSTDALAFGAVNGSTLGVDVDANGGADQVRESFGALTGSSLDSEGCLGAGNAIFQAALTGDVIGSTVGFDVSGQGNDTMALSAVGVNVDAASTVNLTLNNIQGPGSDNLAITYDGVMDGKLSVAARGAAGPDDIAVNVILEPGSTGSVVARVKGGAGGDSLALNVFDHSGNGGPSRLAALDAAIIALASDSLQYTPNVKIWMQN